MRWISVPLALFSLSGPALAQNVADQAVEKPAAIVADGIPPIPQSLAAQTRPYFEYRTAGFGGWNAADPSMIVQTRFADIAQVRRVASPGVARMQMTFEDEPVGGASYSPDGSVLLLSKDIGGNEFDQIFRYENGRLLLLTDDTSRNGLAALSNDGSLVSFSSTRRNGRDTDLYVMDPRDASTARMLAQRQGGGWFAVDFTPDDSSALVINYISVQNMELYLIDLAIGEETRITDPDNAITFSGMQYAPDGRLGVSTDQGPDFWPKTKAAVLRAEKTPITVTGRSSLSCAIISSAKTEPI